MQIIAADQPLSKSMLWDIQRAYFLQAGMQAWQDDIVPHQISCNPFMARAYAQVALGYLQDCVKNKRIDQSKPLYVVELGAGSGRLMVHFIHQLLPLLEIGQLADLNIKFVLTDFVPQIIEFWQSHPTLKPLVEKGLLDFALFDVNDMRPLKLVHSGETLSAEVVQNPLILLANYFFDSIPQDSFVIEEGELAANLLTLYSSQPEPDLADSALWDRLELAYEAMPTDDQPYPVELYNEILADYEAQFSDTSITFPNIGLDCIRFWTQFGNVLLLTADRGYALAEALMGQDDPLPNLHGSFSMMVNYHAMSEYVERAGGVAFVAPHYQDNVQTLAYVLHGSADSNRQTQLAFEQAIVQNGPDDYFGLRRLLESQIEQMTLSQLLSLLRWSAYDGDLLRDCFGQLETLVQAEGEAWYEDVVEMLEKVKAQYLPIRPDDDLLAQIDQLIASLFDTA
ncbi:MAG: hypothetical protein ACI85U_003955 [Candidatus Promineifilaceae bacterium]|jgi:hypothetical protein